MLWNGDGIGESLSAIIRLIVLGAAPVMIGAVHEYGVATFWVGVGSIVIVAIWVEHKTPVILATKRPSRMRLSRCRDPASRSFQRRAALTLSRPGPVAIEAGCRACSVLAVRTTSINGLIRGIEQFERYVTRAKSARSVDPSHVHLECATVLAGLEPCAALAERTDERQEGGALAEGQGAC
jgi:hypothetical protein